MYNGIKRYDPLPALLGLLGLVVGATVLTLAVVPRFDSPEPYKLTFPSGYTIESHCPWWITDGFSLLAYTGRMQIVSLGGQVVILELPDVAPAYVDQDCVGE